MAKERTPRTGIVLDGIALPKLPMSVSTEEHMIRIKNMELRDDDVFLCTYPKAGTHWFWEMASMLLKRSPDYDPRAKTALMLEAIDVEKIQGESSPRIINSHFLFRFLPKQIVERRNKIIHITRNPKDSVVSLFCHLKILKEPRRYKGEFSDFCKHFIHNNDEEVLYGTWFTYVLDWEKTIETNPALQILQLTYEEAKENPVETVKKLAEFLNVPADPNLCSEIATACSFQKLKKANSEVKINPFLGLVQEGEDLYRKGVVGDWKNWFTVAMNEEFDRVYAEKMKNYKKTFKYKL